MAALHLTSFPHVQILRGSENCDDLLHGGDIRDLVRDSSLSQVELSGSVSLREPQLSTSGKTVQNGNVIKTSLGSIVGIQ